MRIEKEQHQSMRDNKYWQGCGGRATPVHYWWQCKLLQPLQKTVERVIKKLKMKLLYDPAIPLWNPKESKMRLQRDSCTPVFIAALFTLATIWEKCPTNGQMDEEELLGIYSGLLFSHEKEGSPAICNNMDEI